MKNDDHAIVNPLPSKNSPKLPAFAALIGSFKDLQWICSSPLLNKSRQRSLYNSKLYYNQRFCIAGPMIGAPYAVMIMESLVAWGAKNILFYGWCGSISKNIEIGTIILPTGAYIDEGTSRHYCIEPCKDFVTPSYEMAEKVRKKLIQKSIPFKEATIWTTDAIYRETAGKVKYYLAKNAMAVEMELSALFTVGQFRQTNVAGLLVVSDDLSGNSWRPGFRKPSFINSRKLACEAIGELCMEM